jgi:hypothetical protein
VRAVTKEKADTKEKAEERAGEMPAKKYPFDIDRLRFFPRWRGNFSPKRPMSRG